MKVIKWEMQPVSFPDNKITDKLNKLLEEGWEPFCGNFAYIFLKRPVGYIEIEEQLIKETDKNFDEPRVFISNEQVAVETNFNLDEIKKVNSTNDPKRKKQIQTRIDNNEFDIEY